MTHSADRGKHINLKPYDYIICCFSGGKDSLAAALYVLAMGADPKRVELWHHCVDGRESAGFMDWPVTESYCCAVAEHLGLPIYFSWRRGGFLAEMMRQNAPTQAVTFDTPDGRRSSGGRGPKNTRMRFPQVSADLSVRWCSAYLKIDVCAAALRNQPRFRHRKTLVITGERAAESPGRARYADFERHRSDARTGRLGRHIDHWRPVLRWSEAEIWKAIEASRIQPHPAYRIGFGRLSCMTCIFASANQWATVRAIAPDRFRAIADYEASFGCTIRRNRPVTEVASAGTPYAAALQQPALVKLALSSRYTESVAAQPWQMPAGAFGESAGPT